MKDQNTFLVKDKETKIYLSLFLKPNTKGTLELIKVCPSYNLSSV